MDLKSHLLSWKKNFLILPLLLIFKFCILIILQFCQQNGGHLVEHSSEEQQDAVTATLDDEDWYWIGLSDQEKPSNNNLYNLNEKCLLTKTPKTPSPKVIKINYFFKRSLKHLLLIPRIND